MLDENFILGITNIHDHDDHDDDDSDEGTEEGSDEEESEEETEEQKKAREEKQVKKAKAQYKDEVVRAYKGKDNSPFKSLFRSKGFIWLSHYPNHHFEWSQAAIQCFVSGPDPWKDVVPDPKMTLKQQAKAGMIGKRK